MIYTKTVDGRQIFSDCRVIQMDDHTWVSNPTDEQIAEAGWVEYIPPEIPPEPMTEPDAYMVMQAVKKMLLPSIESLTDEEALNIAELYPTWASKIGKSVNVGERLWYDEKLYKVIQAHIVQEDWTPDVSTSLYTEVSIEEWPAWRQPLGREDAYRLGDKVSHNDKHWVSDIDYNIYEPGAIGTEGLWREVPVS